MILLSALRRLMQPIILSVLTLWMLGCSPSNEQSFYLINGPTMGTWYNIKYQKPSGLSQTKSQIQASVESVLADINQKMSTYISDSELSRFNQAPVNKPFPLSSETLEVLQISQDVYRQSGGAFDPTVGPLVNLWGFGPDKIDAQIPSPDHIKSALSQVGADAIRLGKGSAQKELPRTIDLSAVAKGYAVDRVADMLEQQGIHSYMVEVGGEIRVGKAKLSGESWQIAIEEPVLLDRIARKVLSITEVSVATSGDYRNYFEKDGKRYSHTIDPTTGFPIQHRLASVTVIHSSSAYADALATALTVLGPEKGFILAQELNLAVYMLVKREGGDSAGFEVLQTDAFIPYVDPSVI